MSYEINKIIQSISDFYKLDNALKYYLDRHKAQILLDYITNLQEELQRYQHYAKTTGIEELMEENERLNNIIKKGIEAINVYQNEKTLGLSYENIKRIRGILRGNEFDLKMFEEYLQELKGSDNNDYNEK